MYQLNSTVHHTIYYNVFTSIPLNYTITATTIFNYILLIYCCRCYNIQQYKLLLIPCLSDVPMFSAETIQELVAKLKTAVQVMRDTDCPVTAVVSGSELFLRFITLATLDTRVCTNY